MNKKGSKGVVAGSVWESRMKSNEYKGGIMVFKIEENWEASNNNNSPEEGIIISNDNGTSTTSSMNTGDQQIVDKRVNFKPQQSPPSLSGKRRTWKSDSIVDGDQIQIARQGSEMSKTDDEQCRELSVSSDWIKKSANQIKKARSDANKELSSSVDSIERTPIQRMKTRSKSQKGSIESSNSTEKSAVQLRKIKSETCTVLNEGGNEKNSGIRKAKAEQAKFLDESSKGKVKNTLQIVRAKTLTSKDFDEKCKSPKVSGDETVPSSVGLRKTQLGKMDGIKRTESDEHFKDFGVCEEKLVTSTSINVGQGKSAAISSMIDDQEQRLNDEDNEVEDSDKESEEEVDEKIENEIEEKSIVVKELSISDHKPKMTVIKEKKHHQSNERPVSVSSAVVKKLPPVVLRNVSVHPTPTKTKSTPPTEEFQRVSKSHCKLESFVNLVMWRDVSKSAFIFGVGTFFIISSSYTQDLHISVISVLSYIGLVYLAAIFLFRSFINRGARDMYSTIQAHVVGEEEAVWLIRLILPYVNEFLINIRALFSGDPTTTMKMAVVLFVLARCGSSITIWKMAKLGFFGVFIVPKVCSSYSSQMTAYGKQQVPGEFGDSLLSAVADFHKKLVGPLFLGFMGKFWIGRFQDAWETCSHKKAVAFGIFTLVWNLSSIVSRIWAVFMLLVAFKYYKQGLMGGESRGQDTTSTDQENSWQRQLERQRKERRSMIMETRKFKKPL